MNKYWPRTWQDWAVTLFVLATFGAMLAAIPLAIITGNNFWLWGLIFLAMYLS